MAEWNWKANPSTCSETTVGVRRRRLGGGEKNFTFYIRGILYNSSVSWCVGRQFLFINSDESRMNRLCLSCRSPREFVFRDMNIPGNCWWSLAVGRRIECARTELECNFVSKENVKFLHRIRRANVPCFYLDVRGFMPYARLSDIFETLKIPSGKYRAKLHHVYGSICALVLSDRVGFDLCRDVKTRN